MITEYLLFIGQWLYFIAALMFGYIFIRTVRVKDGIGLLFLKVLSGCIAIGSMVIFIIRYLSERDIISYDMARAIAVINPIILVGVALYLNHLFKKGR